MNTSEPMIQDYDAVLDARYGKEGTPEREHNLLDSEQSHCYRDEKDAESLGYL